MNFLAVALGGAIGAAGRYAISLMPVKAEFPVLTLITIVLEDRRVRRVYDIFHIFT